MRTCALFGPVASVVWTCSSHLLPSHSNFLHSIQPFIEQDGANLGPQVCLGRRNVVQPDLELRGLRGALPENTMFAFREAIRQGCDAIESGKFYLSPHVLTLKKQGCCRRSSHS